ncbi:GNAT family N-acetyltransferase [Specibacter cremeus]|uniref:GNAT family N-acetyltransferase n=1 Tax=Specibacter cremeus TaxID=1629051 RepID=UPI000F78CF8F|nr:GNAT family N-acetyltransferase [Specibacter cremeus]
MFDIRPAGINEFSLLPLLEAEADAVFATPGSTIDPARLPPPASVAEYAGAFHIMVAGRPPVGFVRLEIVDGLAHLEQLAVSPDVGRRGIGRSLVDAAKAWARESGFTAMTLCTFADVPFNAPFYASCGFSQVALLTPGLARLRRIETELGLDALGRRVVMRAELSAGD